MTEQSPAIDLVVSYIEAVQQARASQSTDDFDAVRRFLDPDVVIKLASAWTDEPWRVSHIGVDAVIERLQAPINTAGSLSTENTHVQQAGDDVVVEQLSIITNDAGRHVSMVCHIFSVSDSVITGVRVYRNDAGLPAG